MAKHTTRKNSFEAKLETRRRREIRKAKQFAPVTLPALAS